ncbi:MAG: hypothetical protein HW421_83 [Ignavibacteria bacterium]|nr:hypothetical protein [Ignavibacteria bacterium]
MKKTLISLLPVLLVLVVIGCQQFTNPTGSSTNNDAAYIPATNYAFPDAQSQTFPIEVSDATMENSMSMFDDLRGNPMGDMMPCGAGNMTPGKGKPPMPPGKGKPPMPPDPRGKFVPLGKILMDLKLTPEQRKGLPAIMKAHKDCMEAAMKALRASEKAIIQAANEQRKAILEQVKAGTLDKDAAKVQLKELNKATREALANNPDRATAQQDIKDCNCKMLLDIRATLDDAQKALFDAWMANFAKDCLATTTPG